MFLVFICAPPIALDFSVLNIVGEVATHSTPLPVHTTNLTVNASDTYVSWG